MRPVEIMNGRFDLGLAHRGEIALGLFRRVLQALQRHGVAAQVDLVFLGEALHQPVDQTLVVVLAAQKGVARGGHDLEDAVGDVEDRHVESAAAQIENRNLAVDLLAEAVGQRRRGGLVDDANHVEAGDAAGVLGRLALTVVEIRRHGDHRLRQGLAEILLGDGAHFLQHVGRDFGNRKGLVAQPDAHVAVRSFHQRIGHRRLDRLHRRRGPRSPDEALDRPGRIFRIGHCLALGDVSHQPFAAFRQGNHRRRGLVAAAVGDDGGVDALKHGHARIRGS